MREIKFRAWDKEYKYMDDNFFVRSTGEIYDYDFPTYDTPNIEIDEQEGFILMQYTGLKDENGVEIYEGDILKLNDIITYVTWMDGAFHIITSENQGGSALVQMRAKRFSVVGNIYEKPELLEGKSC